MVAHWINENLGVILKRGHAGDFFFDHGNTVCAHYSC